MFIGDVQQKPIEGVTTLIHDIDRTFTKDDIKSAPREVLENLIIRIYDGLNDINGTLPDWWDRCED